MPTILYTVQNLVDEVRSQLDEANRDSIDTEDDILPALSRASDFAFDIYSRRYPEPILDYFRLPLQGQMAEYNIPENVFEDRIQKIEIEIPSGSTGNKTYREVQRISYRDLSDYESATQTNNPYYYAIYGRRIRFVPAPTGTYAARIWFLRLPEKPVLPQGRVTVVNTTSNYCIVDSLGDAVTTEADQLGSYVNWVDGRTGEIKATLQIQSLSDNKLTFRTTPTRDTVVGRPVSSLLSAFPNPKNDPTGPQPEIDDYISPVEGSCVPYFGNPTRNFLIQYAVAELMRKLGGPADAEAKVLEKFEQQVERTWVKRETTLRIKKRSQSWGSPLRRWYWE